MTIRAEGEPTKKIGGRRLLMDVLIKSVSFITIFLFKFQNMVLLSYHGCSMSSLDFHQF